MPLFVVFQEAGRAWNDSQPMEEQAGWSEHAAFMNELEAEGFVVMGGPYGEHPHRALLVVNAANENEIRVRLADDPWSATSTLRTAEVAPWEIRLGKSPVR